MGQAPLIKLKWEGSGHELAVLQFITSTYRLQCRGQSQGPVWPMRTIITGLSQGTILYGCICCKEIPHAIMVLRGPRRGRRRREGEIGRGKNEEGEKKETEKSRRRERDRKRVRIENRD